MGADKLLLCAALSLQEGCGEVICGLWAIFLQKVGGCDKLWGMLKGRAVVAVFLLGVLNFSLSAQSEQIFIPLLKEEAPLEVQSVDFNTDGFDDQIILVRNAKTARINIIVGLYDSKTNTYSRAAIIATSFSSAAAMTLSVKDVVGNRTQTLVCEGVNEEGDFVLRLYNYGKKGLRLIGDFVADTLITLNEVVRNSGYEEHTALGEPFTVTLTNSLSKTQNEEALWVWSYDKEGFVQKSTRRVAVAKSTEAPPSSEKSQTFTDFINGLWKKVDSAANSRFIYFDSVNKEAILVSMATDAAGDTQTAYTWEELGRSKNGTYLTCANAIIPSIKRRFDITLNGANTITIHTTESSSFAVSAYNSWDAPYSRVTSATQSLEEGGEEVDAKRHKAFEAVLTKSHWLSEDGAEYTFLDNAYTVTNGARKNSGAFVMDSVGDFCVIQFREAGGDAVYALGFDTTKVTSGKAIKTVQNEDTVYLTPVTLGPLNVAPVDGPTITLQKKAEVTDDERVKMQRMRIMRLVM